MSEAVVPKALVVILTHKPDRQWLHEALWSAAHQSHPNTLCVVAHSCNDPAQWDLVQDELHKAFRNAPSGVFVYAENYPWVPHADVANKVNLSVEKYGEDCKYVVVMSDDDWLAPSFLERQIGALEQDPRLGFAQGQIIYFGDTVGIGQPKLDLKVADQLGQNQFQGTCVMRMDAFRRAGGYVKSVVPEGFPVGLEDFNLFVAMLKMGYGYSVLPEPLLFARQRPQQNNRKLYGTALYLEMLKEVCKANQIELVADGQAWRAFYDQEALDETGQPTKAAGEPVQRAGKGAQR